MLLEVHFFLNRKNKGENSPSSSGSSSQDSPLDPLAVLSSQVDLGQGHELQGLLLEAYRNIGDPDGIYGCGAGRLAEPMARCVHGVHIFCYRIIIVHSIAGEGEEKVGPEGGVHFYLLQKCKVCKK